MARRRAYPWSLILLWALAPTGCQSDRPSTAPTRYGPPAYHPEQFPDIPLYPMAGYELDPNADQLAVVLAGGTVRRFEVSWISRPGTREDAPESVLSRYATELATTGWARSSPSTWVKGKDLLVIEAGRSAGSTTVRFHLRSADHPGPGHANP